MTQVRRYVVRGSVEDPKAPYGWRHHQRKARTMSEAEQAARALHAKLGVEVIIGPEGAGRDLATVRSDAMGRVWCDLESEGARLL